MHFFRLTEPGVQLYHISVLFNTKRELQLYVSPLIGNNKKCLRIISNGHRNNARNDQFYAHHFFFICLLSFHTDIMQSLSFKTKQTGLICFPNMQGENAHNNATISEDLHSITPKSNISERYHLKRG